MMKNPHPAHNRMTALSVALGLIMLLFIAALYSAQILNGSENRARSIASNATWQSVEASRGIPRLSRLHAASSPTATARGWCPTVWPIR